MEIRPLVLSGLLRRVAGLLFAVTLLTGCTDPNRGKYGEVTGTITMDGKPVDGASIQFMPDNSRRSQGHTDASGRYELYVDRMTKGALIGDHAVSISQYRQAALGELIPPKYNRDTTLRRTVSPGHNVIDFELTSDPASDPADEAKSKEQKDEKKPGS